MNRTAVQYRKTHGSVVDPLNGPLCQYCNTPSILRPASFIYPGRHDILKNFWACNNGCDAYVGTHGNGDWINFPLGELSDSELRTLKKKAHELFDPIWKNKIYPRGYCYKWMQKILELPEPDAHIGELNVEQVSRLIQSLNKLYNDVYITL